MTKLWCVKVLAKCYIHLNKIVFRRENLESSYQRHIDGCEQLMNPSDDPVAISHRISFQNSMKNHPHLHELMNFKSSTLPHWLKIFFINFDIQNIFVNILFLIFKFICFNIKKFGYKKIVNILFFIYFFLIFNVFL